MYISNELGFFDLGFIFLRIGRCFYGFFFPHRLVVFEHQFPVSDRTRWKSGHMLKETRQAAKLFPKLQGTRPSPEYLENVPVLIRKQNRAMDVLIKERSCLADSSRGEGEGTKSGGKHIIIMWIQMFLRESWAFLIAKRYPTVFFVFFFFAPN